MSTPSVCDACVVGAGISHMAFCCTILEHEAFSAPALHACVTSLDVSLTLSDPGSLGKCVVSTIDARRRGKMGCSALRRGCPLDDDTLYSWSQILRTVQCHPFLECWHQPPVCTVGKQVDAKLTAH